ncbi:hypothetical protein GEV33_004341 [Tenebrio molitor]|uniref:Uncharacterized protein n=1 Tax=Tenebrio molitor TaxID=7067 RepID=A0A8J6LEJ5_TENMO|nr:hypothetical protein GEV33_004341 [Tenebrio molitor]
MGKDTALRLINWFQKANTALEVCPGASISAPHSSCGSPISKHDSSAGECDSDEKNPDIIPQPVDTDESADYVRKRQHISTIETSPSRGLLHQAGNSGSGGYIGYCTLRNGMPLHELAAQSKMMVDQFQFCPPSSEICREIKTNTTSIIGQDQEIKADSLKKKKNVFIFFKLVPII